MSGCVDYLTYDMPHMLNGDNSLAKFNMQLLESTCMSISNKTEGNKEKAGHLVCRLRDLVQISTNYRFTTDQFCMMWEL